MVLFGPGAYQPTDKPWLCNHETMQDDHPHPEIGRLEVEQAVREKRGNVAYRDRDGYEVMRAFDYEADNDVAAGVDGALYDALRAADPTGVTRTEMEDLVRKYVAVVGEDVDPDTAHTKVRRGDGTDAGRFAALHETLLIELEEDAAFSILTGVPVGDRGYIPAVLTVGGPVRRAHGTLGEAVDRLLDLSLGSGDSPDVICDGGEELCQWCDDAVGRFEVDGMLGCASCLRDWAEEADWVADLIRSEGHGHVLEESADPPTDDTGGRARPVSLTPTRVIDRIAEQGAKLPGGRFDAGPTTQQLWDKTRDAIQAAVRENDSVLLSIPTGGGKSYAAATTNWGARDDLTDGEQTVIFHSTREARDDAEKKARENGVDPLVLRGRDELCPAASGTLDPDESDTPDVTVDDEPVSEFIRRQCDGKGVPFSAVHSYVADHNDQDATCHCLGSETCPAQKQHEKRREKEGGLVIATDNFAHVPGLRYGKHVIADEMPDYRLDLDHEEVAAAVSAYLSRVNAPISSLGGLIRVARMDEYPETVHNEVQRTRNCLREDRPAAKWFIEEPDAHALAPGIIGAILNGNEQGPPGWFNGKTGYEPPRLDSNAHEDEMWNLEWVTAVISREDRVEYVRSTPDMNQTASLVGLDAHPEIEQWRLNTWPDLHPKPVLSTRERQAWRRNSRGLTTIQCGEHEWPLTQQQYYDARGTLALVEQLADRYPDWDTAITSLAARENLKLDMETAGVDDPRLMHYGNVKSRNDFGDDDVGLVLGCIDPGDTFVKGLLTEIGAEARPERSDRCCEVCGDREHAPEEPGSGCGDCDGTGMARAHGRGFVGPDADVAEDLLESVRGSLVAQAVGRWARDATDPDDTAVVYVRTSVLPDHMVDAKVPGVQWAYGRKQREIAEYVTSEGSVTARAVAADLDVSKEHARQTLSRWHDEGYVSAAVGEGKYGATVFEAGDLPTAGTADLGLTTNSHVRESSNVGVGVPVVVNTSGESVTVPWGDPPEETAGEPPGEGGEESVAEDGVG